MAWRWRLITGERPILEDGMMKVELSIGEMEVMRALRQNRAHAEQCGAFTAEQQADDMLMIRAAIQRLAEQSRGLSRQTRAALDNYRHF